MIENLGDFLERVYTFNLGKFFLIDKKVYILKNSD